MKWSFSHRAAFRRCQRQWYYGYVLANANAKRPLRQEAYRLSKLASVRSWRGKLVDNVISTVVVPALDRGRRVSLDEALSEASREFEAGLAVCVSEGRNSTDQPTPAPLPPAFFEIEYGSGPTSEALREAKDEVEQSLRGFFGNQGLWDLLHGAQRLVAQRTLSFRHGAATVSAIPDLIVFCRDVEPLIIDWKVHRDPTHDAWLQLATYAIALTRCKPHRDWPVTSVTGEPSRVRLVEVQLLANEIREHVVSPEDVEDVDDLVSESSTEMFLSLRAHSPELVGPRDFPVAWRPATCQMCNYRKLCWEGEP